MSYLMEGGTLMEYTEVYDLNGEKWILYDIHIVAEHVQLQWNVNRDKVVSQQRHYYLTSGLVIRTIEKRPI